MNDEDVSSRPGEGPDEDGTPGEAAMERADAVLLRQVDEQMDHAYRLGGEHLVCQPGCSGCCVGPFAVNGLEAWRLRRGLRRLSARHPARAAAIRQRAEAARQVLAPSFPGSPSSGFLVRGSAADEQRVEAFLDLHDELPCPVLDPQTGRCELYAHRPITCRSYGPPVDIGGDPQPPCTLCFETVDEGDLEPYRVALDPQGLEETLLDALQRSGASAASTLIAWALVEPPKE